MDFINKINFIDKIKTRFGNPSPYKKKQKIKSNSTHSSHIFNTIPTDNYIYIELDSLPKNGWIQGCCCCYDPTTRIEQLGSYHAYFCGKCAKLPEYKKINIINNSI